MSAEADVYAALSTAAGVTALVGNRIFPDIAEQGVALPLIVFTRQSSDITTTIHDDKPAASKVAIAASAWATTRLAAEQIADAMQTALRTTGVSVNRFAHFDFDTAAYAAVVEFEVWEL